MWNLVTLEGFFEGPKKWDLDWHEYVWGDELEELPLEQRKTADALLSAPELLCSSPAANPSE
jgi:hypothetical protein